MNITRLFKYAIRFIILQLVLTSTTIYYFNNFLIPDNDLFPDQKGYTFRDQINNNLYEDASRFFPFLNDNLINIELFLSLFIFIFLIFLYSTKFYTYVNELTFSLDRNYLDEYFSIYLTWTASLMIFLTMFRFSNLISRGYLLIFTFLIPLILLLFRNSEFLSSLIGRSVTDENYITINLKEDSIFRSLRIITFRKALKNITVNDFENTNELIEIIDQINKKSNLNLVIINFENETKIDGRFENYLINLNKKILIISKNRMHFNNYFINRSEEVSGYFLTYFNNDIQYGSKYIIKRALDIVVSLFALVLFSPIFIFISIYIYILDGLPVIIKQERIGLHGQSFNMYKFRTMKLNSHEMRSDLQDQNEHDAEIFKMDDDPRVLNGAKFIRSYSLDEFPQFFNVIKGNMSIVGPRPLFDEDTQLFNENYMRRLNVLPGITGLLQINERNTSEFSTWYKYDIEYIDNWTLFLDLKIILKTPLALVKGNTKGV
tara:strand:- start:4349 stop:5815 length:1467 start_codon:yes stop_codon:yes gene_type:complete